MARAKSGPSIVVVHGGKDCDNQQGHWDENAFPDHTLRVPAGESLFKIIIPFGPHDVEWTVCEKCFKDIIGQFQVILDEWKNEFPN